MVRAAPAAVVARAARRQVRGHAGVAGGRTRVCGDRSECTVHRNVVSATRRDPLGDLSRVGVGIESDFQSVASLRDNVLVGNPVATRAFAGSRFDPRVIDAFAQAVKRGDIQIEDQVRGAA